jgi:hypothetical protein
VFLQREQLQQKTYVCTSDAVRGGFCDYSQLGRFILDLPGGKSVNETSFWSARMAFSSQNGASPPDGTEISSSGLWDNGEDNPTPPDGDSEYTSPWKRGNAVSRRSLLQWESKRQDTQALNPSPSGILYYDGPIQYLVRKTGYYCVGKRHNIFVRLQFLMSKLSNRSCYCVAEQRQ